MLVKVKFLEFCFKTCDSLRRVATSGFHIRFLHCTAF